MVQSHPKHVIPASVLNVLRGKVVFVTYVGWYASMALHKKIARSASVLETGEAHNVISANSNVNMGTQIPCV